MQQALQQMNTPTALLPPTPTGNTETTADAGNSFGVASYGSRNVQFCQSLPTERDTQSNSKVQSGDRRQIAGAHTDRINDPSEANVTGQCELDNHADTCCLGQNFIPLYYTGKVCDIAPFLNELPNQQDVPICMGATAFDDGNGTTTILIINEVLWFGEHMKHSLINPNQVRAHGISLCNNPMDPYQSLGLTTQDVFIPFFMSGTTCSFTTRTPSDWELENCVHVEITSDIEWDPKGALFTQHLDNEAGDTVQDISASAYDTRHRRSDIEPSVLAKQWGIGLDTAIKTLKATTQAGIRHAIHPLNRRYQTDHMIL